MARSSVRDANPCSFIRASNVGQSDSGQTLFLPKTISNIYLWKAFFVCAMIEVEEMSIRAS
jgi:hypothetical protein